MKRFADGEHDPGACMPRDDIAVEVKELRRNFGAFVAVDGISLTVAKGEVFGFLGPNGAGKSTTIRMLCGLLMPTGGNGTVGGYNIVTEPERVKKTIGYMSQKFSLYSDLTVEENIDFFGGAYGVPKDRKTDRKRWALEMAGLKDRSSVVTKNLATGFKQRLALACAILHQPSILFLDEPTSGVDPAGRRNFWDLIYSMAREGTTVFVTTHYMDEADYCDRLALIYRGKIIAEGSPSVLRREYMRKEIFEVEVDDVVTGLDALLSRGMDAALFGNTLHVTADALDAPRIRESLESAGRRVRRIERIVASLEDVFVTLIEEA